MMSTNSRELEIFELISVNKNYTLLGGVSKSSISLFTLLIPI